MGELKDGFMRDLDKEKSGINGKCDEFQRVLKLVDNAVYNKLLREKVNP